ncbi:hypothetical protein SteCoe_18597 [Stentor coeruleus]|uniref:Uncharacterized protein n=1 Tax=Stentor coeruleus TaxID=5963 RepID=A0A1R2BW91_9CILI|nr:hypothetical protein SteCoe_18597 [Stentor coeruleus]
MKVFERPRSNPRSMTPKRITSTKPPFPKLIQKKPKANPIKPNPIERNKENLPLEMILSEDALLFKPNEIINQTLYTQSPIGELHVCFPYELPGNQLYIPISEKPQMIEISTRSTWDSTRDISVGFESTSSISRNSKVKLLSKNFKLTRNSLTRYKCDSQNATPEPREF